MTDSFSTIDFDSQTEGTVFHRKTFFLDSVESTNTLALQAASEGAGEGTVFVANMQTQGKGRGGHSWHSEPGTGIYCSLVLRPRWNPSDALILSLLAGIAAHYAIESVAGISPDIRWPNDLLLEGKKFGGILTELSADARHIRHAVIGIGINVGQRTFPSDLQEIATSLFLIAGADWPRSWILCALLKSLSGEYRRLGSQSDLVAQRPDILRRFEALSTYVRGKHVRVEEEGGYSGITAGLNEHGLLLVQTSEGLRTVLSGGVRELK